MNKNKEIVDAEVINTTESKEEVKGIKATRFEVEQQLNQFIGNLKVEGMSPDAKLALVELKLELSKITKEIEEFRKTTLASINKPENYDKLKEDAEKEGATDEAKAAYKVVEDEYNKAFTEVALPYFNDIVSIPFDYISKDDFRALVKHNDLNVIFGYEYIYEKLVK